MAPYVKSKSSAFSNAARGKKSERGGSGVFLFLFVLCFLFLEGLFCFVFASNQLSRVQNVERRK